MLMAGVDIPDEILSKQRDGKLVVFAGAGVSMGSPANYPDFPSLAQSVLHRAGDITTRRTDEPVDRFLGRLVDLGVGVHSLVKEMLSRPDSQPTALHRDLLSLFSSPNAVRLVTTNFDRHFSTAARSVFEDALPEYRAPALPVGYRFHGIVYLHGCVEQAPEDLVLTDRDFGRAYLMEGWARRFLVTMFGQYTVLFVGYSHGDPIMNYLARALPPATSRYILTSGPTDELWRSLEITPIGYTQLDDADRHRPLRTAIAEWVRRNRMGYLDHEQRIRRITESPPPLDPEDIDYVKGVVKESATLRIFINYARSAEWLRWLEESGFLDCVFDSRSAADDTSNYIAGWFAQNFVCTNSEDGLAVIMRKGVVMSDALWRTIAHQIHFNPPSERSITGKWVAVLLASPPVPGQQNGLLELLLNDCVSSKADEAAYLLFEYLTRPSIRLEKDYRFTSDRELTYGVRGRIELICSPRLLAREGGFRSRVGALAGRIEPLLTTRILQIYDLLSCTGQTWDWDPLSLARSAIEPHSQNHYLHNWEMLIDAGRDVIESLFERDTARGLATAEAWASSERALLTRLAIHGIRTAPGLPPDDKVMWLIDRELVFAHEPKHEVFALLRDAYPSSGDETKRTLLSLISAHLQPKDAGLRAAEEADLIAIRLNQHRALNLLAWLSCAAPECQLASGRMANALQSFPEFRPDAHPDLYSYSGPTVSWDPVTEMPSARKDLSGLLAQPVGETARWLLDEQDRYRARDTTRALTAMSFDWSRSLIDELPAAGRDCDLWESLVRGWAMAEMNEQQWESALNLLQGLPHLQPLDQPIAELLLGGIEPTDRTLPQRLLDTAERISEALWERLESQGREQPEKNGGPQNDWLFIASYSPAGMTVHFRLMALSRRLRVSSSNISSLPESYKIFFETVISGGSTAAEMGRIILAENMGFLFHLDTEWTRANLLPLLSWSVDRRRAQQAWHGYLRSRGAFADSILADLMPSVEDAFARLADDLATEPNGEYFCRHLAYVAVYASMDPLEHGWLRRFTATAPEPMRTRWVSALAGYISRLPDDGKLEIWHRWLEKFWRDRVHGSPLALSPDEVEEMIKLALELGPAYDPAVDLIVASAPPDAGEAIHHLHEGNLPETKPESTTRLFVHLLSSGSTRYWHCGQLVRIAKRLAASGVSRDHIRGICDSLLGHGCHIDDQLRDYIGTE